MTDGRDVPDFTLGGWSRAVAVGPYRIYFHPDGTVRFGHRCDRGERGVIICDPALQIGRGHTVISDDPVTIVASILCPDCGTHGWVTDGRWVPA